MTNKPRWVRQQLELTQIEFAEAVGVTQAAVSRWEVAGEFRCTMTTMTKIRNFCREHIRGWKDDYLFSPPAN